MVDLAWYQRTMVPLDCMVPAYLGTTGMVPPAYHGTTGWHGTSIPWYYRHGTSVQGVVGPRLSQREVHSQIVHPALQIDNGRLENGVKAFHHAISLSEIT